MLFQPYNHEDADKLFITIGDNPDVRLNAKCTKTTVAGWNNCDDTIKGIFFGIYADVTIFFKQVMVYR